MHLLLRTARGLAIAPSTVACLQRRCLRAYAVAGGETQHATSQEPPLSSYKHRPKARVGETRDIKPRAAALATQDVERTRKRELSREMDFLHDPLKLADHTLSLLQKDDSATALEKVRFASRDTDCVVSWNHLIDYHMSKDNSSQAWKIYNEMKKRAQFPDSYTYTLMLRGFATKNSAQALARALSIYHSMYAENAKVRPSIIHTNAMLQVCARAGDLDALFGVAARLPTKGFGAADAWTFTTVLNAVRMAVRTEDAASGEKEASPKARENIERAVIQGRRMWEDVVERWSRGDMSIDEYVVNAMGRLLLEGNTMQDSDDILNLAEQTMGIRRKVAPWRERPGRLWFKGKPVNDARTEQSTTQELQEPDSQNRGHRQSQKFTTVGEFEVGDVHSITTTPTVGDITSGNDGLVEQERSASSSLGQPRSKKGATLLGFRPLPPSEYPIELAKPSQATLSLLLTACLNMHAWSAAQAYWGELTDPKRYNVTPDAENYICYLRLLRQYHASRAAADLIDDMIKPTADGGMGIVDPPRKVFKLAMSACGRDNKNNNVVPNALRVLTAMRNTLEDPDPEVLRMFIELVHSKVHNDPRARRPEIAVASLTEADLVLKNLRSLLAYGSSADKATLPPGRREEDSIERSKPPSIGNPISFRAGIGARIKSKAGMKRPFILPPGAEDVRLLAKQLVFAHDAVLQTMGEVLNVEDRDVIRERRDSLKAWEEKQWRLKFVDEANRKQQADLEAAAGVLVDDDGNVDDVDDEEVDDEGDDEEGGGGGGGGKARLGERQARRREEQRERAEKLDRLREERSTDPRDDEALRRRFDRRDTGPDRRLDRRLDRRPERDEKLESFIRKM